MTTHQQKQIQVIDRIEEQISQKSLQFSVVDPVEDFEKDTRICLTGIHIPSDDLKSQIDKLIIKPLKEICPGYYFYFHDSLHMTIKNIRVINEPPHFSSEDIEKAKQVFKEIIPSHHKFRVYFYRLLLFPNNLALVGTTDPELDRIILDLDQKLNEAGLPDDKTYVNSRYFFSNMTLARFGSHPTQGFKDKVRELSGEIKFEPYTVDSVTLVTANAVFKKLRVIESWNLKS